VAPDVIPKLLSMIERGNYYSGLCHMRQLFPLEAELLAFQSDDAQLKVA
jgi:flagellar protein FlbT